MTYITFARDVMTIGEVSRRTRIPVRTIRFYCDEGILAAHRTTGGHRVFTPDVVDQLTLIRQLRAVGLGLAVIAEVLASERTTPDAVSTERAAVEAELGSLSWRQAVLLAIEQADDQDRTSVLSKVAAVAERRAARTTLVDFWRQILSTMPNRMFDDFVEMDVPTIPDTAPCARFRRTRTSHTHARSRTSYDSAAVAIRRRIHP